VRQLVSTGRAQAIGAECPSQKMHSHLLKRRGFCTEKGMARIASYPYD
jgi:hypothetical protein